MVAEHVDDDMGNDLRQRIATRQETVNLNNQVRNENRLFSEANTDPVYGGTEVPGTPSERLPQEQAKTGSVTVVSEHQLNSYHLGEESQQEVVAIDD